MGRKKAFASDAHVLVVSTEQIAPEDGGAIVHIGVNATDIKNIDLTPWLGRGINDMVWAVVAQLRAFIVSGKVTGATIVNYGSRGIPTFFTFLIENGITRSPMEIDRQLVASYVDWLKAQTRWSFLSQKNHFSNTKPVLVALQRRGLIPADTGHLNLEQMVE